MNDVIRYKVNDEWVTGTIMGRAGKVIGKYKAWYNVRDDNNEDRSIDLGNIEWEKIRDTEINVTAVTASDKKTSQKTNIIRAKENELDKLSQFNSYEEVEASGQEILSTRWVITTKEGKTKAR